MLSLPVHAVRRSQDPLVGDKGAAAEVQEIDEESHLVGPRVGRRFRPAHDASCMKITT